MLVAGVLREGSIQCYGKQKLCRYGLLVFISRIRNLKNACATLCVADAVLRNADCRVEIFTLPN